MFYARTPCVAPLMGWAGRLGVRWDFTFPAHLHDLGQAFWEGWFARGGAAERFRIVRSRPSIVETTLSKHLVRTVVARVIKSPWYVLGRSYGLVGGWEIFATRR